ncbi:hypothetical protein AS361_16395 [Myroides marinus]|uniref:hypothetical protein n=1 Tax=Myroides marinus TaxID=703342 RepID=UPI0007422D66|nr:hypothetical protein [Myroides marinus]KUF43772.1 hypothetical protein AS361_16395 [Myroides marinus]
MKKALMLMCLAAVMMSCKENNTTSVKDDEKATIEKVTDLPNSEKVNQLLSEMLVPMEIADEGAKNLTDKYGIDFGGTCYACDVAEIIVDGEMINLMNACDVQTQIGYPNKNRSIS